MNECSFNSGFQVREGALKKIAPSRGRRENFRGISCEKSLFYAKKSFFLQLRREALLFDICYLNIDNVIMNMPFAYINASYTVTSISTF
jgi:hypothetical protein